MNNCYTFPDRKIILVLFFSCMDLALGERSPRALFQRTLMQDQQLQGDFPAWKREVQEQPPEPPPEPESRIVYAPVFGYGRRKDP